MCILTISKNNSKVIENVECKNYTCGPFKFKDIKIELLNNGVLYQNEIFIGYNIMKINLYVNLLLERYMA
ncbi:hypothetical protein EXM98_14140 [Clostridium botulinum]|uniref:hypothetical protein n=1 Tax=Clostridium botulinum TaxID=1491 RepID=UPI00069695E3|nr:hypothetical protein [Clostridium botulinum]MBY6800473.1 hypothetical protein [Clostridium botulinum]MBY6997806.1 hypothetical protein [Clostridium botulinum]MBY7010063.1 hypothetical protein [Clostridium botulinum]MCC5439067.1 hypothetical protein [Clostridium botulinum]MCR1154640.1 hypothetical protein [Clostridium botulinum]